MVRGIDDVFKSSSVQLMSAIRSPLVPATAASATGSSARPRFQPLLFRAAQRTSPGDGRGHEGPHGDDIAGGESGDGHDGLASAL